MSYKSSLQCFNVVLKNRISRFLRSKLEMFIIKYYSFLYYHDLITNLAENYRTCPPFPKSAKLSTSTLNKSKISTWRDPRSWYHLTFTSIEGVKSDFCRACTRLTFRNRLFVFLWSVTAMSIPCIILLVGTEFCTWMPASSYAFFWSAVLIWSTVLSFIVSDITCS